MTMNTNNEKNELTKYENAEQSSAVAKIGKVNETLTILDSMITNTTTGIANIVQITSSVKIAMQSLENEMEQFRINAQKDAYLYEKSLPMWEQQLNRIQDRIDKVMDRVLSSESSDFSETAIQRQNMLMDVLTEVNDSFNTMVMKLMTR